MWPVLFQDGDRAIHLAVQNGDQEIVNLLVAYQADINSPNYRRVTPLAVACKLQDWQMVNHLLDKQVREHESNKYASQIIYMPILWSVIP